MSVRESSDTRDLARFTTLRGLLMLTLGLLVGPTVALINQQLIYSANMWACGRQLASPMHLIPALCLIATIGSGVMSYHDWNAVGRGGEEEHEGVAGRTRFLSILGMVISVFSAMVILAQWAAIFTFDPCMRA
jgi:hypothetical protein